MNTQMQLSHNTKTFLLPDLSATHRLGQAMATLLNPPFVIFFQGELGAGKTTLIRAILKSLAIKGPIKSPTYSLVEPYSLSKTTTLYHLDLYRLQEVVELIHLGCFDDAPAHTIYFIEWAEKGKAALPKPDVICHLDDLILEDNNANGEGRRCTLSGESEKGKVFLGGL